MTQFSATNRYSMAKAISLGLSGIEKSTLLHLSTFADRQFQCFPSMKKLSEITGFSESAIKRAIKKLEELKLITKKRRFSSSGPTSNLYKLNISVLNGETNKDNYIAIPDNAYLAQDGNYYSCPADYYKSKSANEGGQLHA